MITLKMKKSNIFSQIALFGALAMVVASCTDPIDIELDEGTPQLNVDAFIDDQDIVQRIRIVETTNYFDNGTVNAIADATVTIADNDGNTYPFSHTKDGYFESESTGAEMIKGNQEYTLKVVVGERSYLATSNTLAPPPIDSLTFDEISGDGPGALNGYIGYFWATDIPGEENFYWIKAFRNDTFLSDPNFLNTAQNAIQEGDAGDGLQFIPPIAQGITTFPDIYQKDDKVRVELHSISIGTYLFLAEARTQITNGGLFAEPPYNVRTNIENVNGSTESKEQAVGWFSTSMVSSIEGKVGDN